MSYAATHLDVVITYCKSDMIIAVHSDVSYLRKSKTRSCAGGYFSLSNDSPLLAKKGEELNIA